MKNRTGSHFSLKNNAQGLWVTLWSALACLVWRFIISCSVPLRMEGMNTKVLRAFLLWTEKRCPKPNSSTVISLPTNISTMAFFSRVAVGAFGWKDPLTLSLWLYKAPIGIVKSQHTNTILLLLCIWCFCLNGTQKLVIPVTWKTSSILSLIPLKTKIIELIREASQAARRINV